MPDAPESPVPAPSDRLELVATCTFGLEAVVVRELEVLGYEARPIGTGRVLFQGDLRAIVDANLWLRAADRVLIRLAQFPVGAGDPGFDQLFEGVKAIPWERWIAPTAAFPVSGRCVRSHISSEPAVQRATKRAIVERLRAALSRSHPVQLAKWGGVLPESSPPVAVEIALVENTASLTIDTSGDGLHKRGYRASPYAPRPAIGEDTTSSRTLYTGAGEAAIRETLAAGLVLLSVWRPPSADAPDSGRVRPFVDPFCGAGTIAIEAAMIGRNIAPGLMRTFAAEHWLDPAAPLNAADPPRRLIDPELWQSARDDALDAAVDDRLDPPIHATDIDENVLRLARANAKAAGVDEDIHFATRDVAELKSKLDYGVIVTNPPYGIRLGDDRETERLYRSLPAVFRRLPTWSFHIFTGRLDMERLFGQVANRRRKLYNAKIECCLFSFLGPRPPRSLEGAGPPVGASIEDAMAGGDAIDAESIEAVGEHPGELETLQKIEEPRASSPDAVSVDVPRNEPAQRAPRPPRPAVPDDLTPTFGGLRERDEREAAEFGRCLANNLRHLRKYPSRGIHCFRVYERDVPDVPLIVDRYADHFHVAEYERRHSRTAAQQADWFDLMRSTIAKVAEVPPANVWMKEKHRQRGTSQHEKQASSRHIIQVSEGEPPLKFEVNLSDYIDTGLFLDHRLTREMVRKDSAGKRVLNLFCYTGSFTVYAASAGARSTTSVDLSNTYLDWCARNMRLNNFAIDDARHRLLRSDVMEFLRYESVAAQMGGNYDLAIVDPPTFSNSASTDRDWEVQDDYTELLERLAPLMSPGATIYFSNNHRRFKLNEDAVAALGLASINITSRTIPPEYRNKRIHQCWRMQNVGPDAARAALESRRTRSARPPQIPQIQAKSADSDLD